jgi:hypothetical protein
VALAALVVSLAVAAWNVIQFRREGVRVKVKIQPGLFDRNSLVTVDTYCGDRNPDKLSPRPRGRFDVEVAVIRVENRGRTPVTVRGPALDLGRVTWWKPGRHVMTFRPLKFGGHRVKPKTRLEPYDDATFLVDMSHALWAIGKDLDGDLALRASVGVAGGRTKRSSFRRRWRLPAGSSSLWPGETFDLAREVYRFLAWRARGDDTATLMLPEIAMRIAEHVEGGGEATAQQLDELVKRTLEGVNNARPFAAALWGYDLAAEFARPGGRFDGSSAHQRRYARVRPPADEPDRQEPSRPDTDPGPPQEEGT